MAKKYDESDGIWRTVGGRRIFIKNDQTLADAMKESGKFKKGTKYVNKNGAKIEIDDYTKEGQPQFKDNQGNVRKASDDESLERILKDNGYTSEQLKEKYGTDDVDLINAGKAKEDRVSKIDNKHDYGYTNDQLKQVWENEDATEVYDYLTSKEKSTMKMAQKDAEMGNKDAQNIVDKLDKEAASRFIESNSPDYIKNVSTKLNEDEVTSYSQWKKDYGTNIAELEKDLKLSERYLDEDSEGYREAKKSLENGRKYLEDLKKADQTIKSDQTKYRSEFEEYKRKHPKTDLSLADYIKIKHAGVGAYK